MIAKCGCLILKLRVVITCLLAAILSACSDGNKLNSSQLNSISSPQKRADDSEGVEQGALIVAA